MDRDITQGTDTVTSAQGVRSYLEGVTRDDFRRNVQLQDTVIRRLPSRAPVEKSRLPDVRARLNRTWCPSSPS